MHFVSAESGEEISMLGKLQKVLSCVGLVVLSAALIAPAAFSQTVTYKPYIQPGDNGSFGASDQMVGAWQTSGASPNPSADSVEFGTSVSYEVTVQPQGPWVDSVYSYC